MESILFALLALMGEQAATWWKLGPCETFGMFILALALVFMAQSVYGQKKRILYEILFIIFAIIASLTKESFILFIPGLLCWKIWLTYKKTGQSIRAAVFKNWPATIILLAVIGAELVYIVNVIGTTGISYAGYEGFNIPLFFKTGARLSIYAHAWILLIQLFPLVLFYKYANPGGRKKEIKELAPPVILFMVLVLPQVVLYMKSGIGERYLLPGVIGYYFLMIYFFRYIRLRIPPRFSYETGKFPAGFSAAVAIAVSSALLILNVIISIKWPFEIFQYQTTILAGVAALSFLILLTLTLSSKFKELFYTSIFDPKRLLALLSIAFFVNLTITAASAGHFAAEGRNIAKWFQSIEQHSHEPGYILIVTDNTRYFEWSYSLKTYLERKMKRKNIYASPVTLNSGQAKHKYWDVLNRDFLSRFPAFSLSNSRDRDRFETILILPGLEKDFLKHSSGWFRPAQFERYVNPAGFVSYYKVRLPPAARRAFLKNRPPGPPEKLLLNI